MEKFGNISRDVSDKMHGGYNFENNLNQTENLKFQKNSPTVLQTFKTLYCHQYSADFTYVTSLARELFLPSRLMFRENGSITHFLRDWIFS